MIKEQGPLSTLYLYNYFIYQCMLKLFNFTATSIISFMLKLSQNPAQVSTIAMTVNSLKLLLERNNLRLNNRLTCYFNGIDTY